jgi:hypothetical protein
VFKVVLSAGVESIKRFEAPECRSECPLVKAQVPLAAKHACDMRCSRQKWQKEEEV